MRPSISKRLPLAAPGTEPVYLLQSFEELSTALRSVLSKVEAASAYPYPIHKSRFSSYAHVLEEEQRTFTGSFAHLSGKRRTLVIHACDQVHRLVISFPLLEKLPLPALRDTIIKIFGGEILPPPGDKEDLARDILVELSTAAQLHEAGYRVRLSQNNADFEVITPEGVYAAECKRPINRKTLDRAVRKMCKNFKRRSQNRGQFVGGIAIFAFDRILGERSGEWGGISMDHTNENVLQVLDTYRPNPAKILREHNQDALDPEKGPIPVPLMFFVMNGYFWVNAMSSPALLCSILGTNLSYSLLPQSLRPSSSGPGFYSLGYGYTSSWRTK